MAIYIRVYLYLEYCKNISISYTYEDAHLHIHIHIYCRLSVPACHRGHWFCMWHLAIYTSGCCIFLVAAEKVGESVPTEFGVAEVWTKTYWWFSRYWSITVNHVTDWTEKCVYIYIYYVPTSSSHQENDRLTSCKSTFYMPLSVSLVE